MSKAQYKQKLNESLMEEFLAGRSRSDVNAIMTTLMQAYVDGTISFQKEQDPFYSFYLDETVLNDFRSLCSERKIQQKDVLAYMIRGYLDGKIKITQTVTVE